MCCSISFPLFALLNSAIIFMLFTLQSCVKLIHIKNETWCFFCSFQSANPKFIHQYHVFFVLCSISHAFANPLRFISPMQHSHIHTVFKHNHEQDAMIEKQNLYNVTTDWWKLVKKSRMKWKKMSCAVTYNAEGMVEAGIGSEKFLRIRILEILKETPFFGPSS